MSYNSTLDDFCGSKFWDANLSWYTENPEFTPCFEKTVLIWIPCSYLWVAALLDAYYIYNSKERNIPWNALNIIKLVITFLLIVLKFVDLGVTVHKSSRDEAVFNVDYYAPVVKILTFALSATLLYYNRKYGMRASGVLFFFWFFLILAGLPQLRSEIMMHYELAEDENVQYNFVSYMIYYPLIILMFILNCFADLPPKESPYKYNKNQCPESASGFPSRLTFSWFDPLALTGFRRSLVESDLWALNPQDSSKEVVPKFDKFWERTLSKREKANGTKATYSNTSASVNFKPDKEVKPASILPALCLAFGGEFLFGALLKLVNDVLMFLSPQLLKLLIGFVDTKETVWKGYLYAVGLFACATAQTLLLSHYFTRMYLVGMRIRTALTSAVYRKSMRISNSARKETTVGEIVNLMAVDAQRFVELTAYLNMIWSAPLQIALALYFLWGILGPSVLAGLAVMIVLIPVNGLIANRVKTLQIRQMKYKDERVKLMNEVLNGIKVLKMYAWEPSFEAQILKIRNKEMNVLKQTAYLNSATSFIWSCAPFLVTFLTFFTYVISDPVNNVLKPDTIFVSMSLFYIMHLPLGLLPIIVVSIIETSVGIKRLNKFMNCDELNLSAVEHDPKEPNPIVIENGHFSWSDESEPVLKNINLQIPRGGLVAVVGAVGSGKSSLLSALLGEMNKISGRVNTNGVIAYVPQQAWIQNATLQDNILFGKPLEKVKYNNVINVCALKPDFDVLPGGDQTEIGEKGINLSGGQKQRVSLARAVYYDADNYFLDDPLSAVDSHVGKHIFDKVIGPNGLLKGKTRVWVTHNVSYLAQTDLVLVLRDGVVSEAGTYQQLLEKKGAFADFLLHHLSDKERTTPEELDVIKQELESKLGSEFQNKLQRARSLSESTSESEQATGDRSGSVKRKTPEAKPSELKEKNKLIEAEKTETGSVKWSVYKHYLTSVGLVASALTVLMNLVLQVFQVGSNYWLSEWSNDNSMLVNGTVDKSRRDLYLGVYGGLGIGQVVSVSVSSLALYLGTLCAARALHAALLMGVLRAPTIGFFDCTPVGRALNRFSKDVDVLDNVLPMTLRGWTSCFFSVLGTLFVISYSTPIFLAVILPIGIVYYVIQRFYVASSRQLKRLESVSRSPIYSHFGESITGAQTIRAYGVTQRFIEESEHGVDHNQACYYPSCIANRWLAIRLEMIGNLIIFFAALFAVLSRETINPGIVGLSISYSLQITQTLNWLVRMTSEVETNIVAVERIKEYAETKQEAPWTVPSGPGSTWPETGALQLERLSLGYRSDEPALRDLTCVVAPGDKLGIVGRTGAGKSTLTLGLFRIVEAMSGKILIDGIDISTIGLHQLRSKITIIPQDPVLFAGTLRMNLDPFEVYSDEDIWRSLEHAHLKAFVQGLQAGLLHEISEGGENLSVGQRQLVCLARALLRKTPLLILDEATAAVDLETDELIQKTIRSEFASCTVLTIAHRLNTIMDSTRVMVLDRGQLVEYAPPQQLLQDKNSIFYGMAKDAGLVN
ncbi:multidrug resistance-associated protein 1 isoform X1 [Danaus plexippus]|uniref:multidrug resistance-associated protein 1 isoform X1 n=1 Tax=Danaus plexippus TaxID=13037 RepID=UPI002AB06794|nr:multidrug resistance-associated protein 1 isoform X1 [Danaus plexippus]XP_061382571.1 multidrug resistance-associated protein 1 isoform X1 [Danaus plexippus]XP_061382575.1 multidrug resistance-associated protein 1 isoform X1 [Danaus plexippus]XP_061382578.1 multidrug resistance-associated protein 1 isoform X1 [Danaus plexippus]